MAGSVKGQPRGAAKHDAIHEIVSRLVAAHPDAPAQTLARRLIAECNGALTLNQANCRIRRAFGVMGKMQRAEATNRSAFRPPRQAGEVPQLPPSKADPWEPFTLEPGTIGVLSDIHVPYHDETALRAAVDCLAGERVDTLVLNGDWMDFYSISRHEKNPKHRNLRGELDAAREFLRWVRHQFPLARIVAKDGNHEERWERWLWQHAPEISDEPEMRLDRWMKLGDLEIEHVGDKRIVLAGKLPILHGHEKGNGISSPVNQARGAFLRLHHTVLEGHGHRTSTHAEPDMFGRETVCFSTGCLCDMRPRYAVLNKWNHGAARVQIHADGSFDVTNFRIVNGKVRLS